MTDAHTIGSEGIFPPCFIQDKHVFLVAKDKDTWIGEVKVGMAPRTRF